MTAREKLLGLMALAALACAIALGYIGLEEHDARVRAEATVKASQTVADSAATQQKDLAAAEQQRDAQTAATLAAMEKLVATVKTPQQAASFVASSVPVPQPITVNIPQATPAEPTPPATFTVPQADLPAIRDAVATCQECSLKLQSALADSSSKDAQLKAAGEQLSAVSNERDAYKKAVNGTFLSRVKTAAKYMALGAAIGALAARK